MRDKRISPYSYPKLYVNSKASPPSSLHTALNLGGLVSVQFRYKRTLPLVIILTIRVAVGKTFLRIRTVCVITGLAVSAVPNK